MVFQEHGLFPWLTAAQNIEFGLKMAGVPRSERDDRVAAALRNGSPDRTAPTSSPTNCPAACASASPSPGPW